MDTSREKLSRRTFLGGMVVLPALAGLLATDAAADDTKASQDSMHYQSTPSGNMHCFLCRFFIPGQDATANGTCQIVDGTISPNGYCIAFTAKAS